MNVKAFDVENKIKEVFHRLLNTTEIERNDKFLDVGGTSQGLVELTSEICSLFDVDIELIDVFENQSIDLLTKIIVHEVTTCT